MYVHIYVSYGLDSETLITESVLFIKVNFHKNIRLREESEVVGFFVFSQ